MSWMVDLGYDGFFLVNFRFAFILFTVWVSNVTA